MTAQPAAAAGFTRRPGRRIVRLGVVALAVAAALPLTTFTVAPASAAGVPLAFVHLPADVPRLPPGASRLGALAPGRSLDLDVVLRPNDPAALDAFATAVATPGSAEYHHYLARGQFGSLYGASEAAVSAVTVWLKSQDLSVGALESDGLLLPVSGSVAHLDRAFDTSVDSVRLRGGRAAYADVVAPDVPSQVEDVVGLDDLDQAQTHLLRHDAPSVSLPNPAKPVPGASDPAAGDPATDDHLVAHQSGASPCPAAAQVAADEGGYTSNEIADAYDISPLYGEGRTGAGVTVALYELAPADASSVASFQQCMGTSTTVNTVSVDGGAGSDFDSSGEAEAVLDVEDVIGLAPEANIDVYEGPNDSTGPMELYARIFDDDTATVVSTSWGDCEADLGSSTLVAESLLFEQAEMQGQTVLAAAGDAGSEDCYSSDGSDQLAVDDPGSQPWVTSVGGTSLTSYTDPSNESVWNNCFDASQSCASPELGAGGGGLSSFWNDPDWQQGLSTFSVPGNGGGCPVSSGPGSGPYCRAVPDVAASADPDSGDVIYDSGWEVIGGTSAAAPVWAAVVALIDEGCNASAGFLNPELYALGRSADPPFYTVTSGNNDFTDSSGGRYPAGTPYNLASGWGAPNAAALVADFQTAAGETAGCPVVTGISSTSGTNHGGGTMTITGSSLGGATSVHFGTIAAPIVTDAATSVTVDIPAYGGSVTLPTNVRVTTPDGTSTASPQDRYVYVVPGYWLVGSDGGIFSFGGALFNGSCPAISGGCRGAVVGIAPTSDRAGYWLADRNGDVYTFGDAPFYGSVPALGISVDDIVEIVPTPDGGGYWLVGSDGGVFTFGDAPYHGSTGGERLNKPIVGMAPTADGAGYWLVGSDGGVFTFGDAPYHGSTGGERLNKPIVGMAPTADGAGYWLVASDGGVFTFGDAPYRGSTGGERLNKPIVGMAPTADGAGYWLVASDGGIFTFGDAPYDGSTGAERLSAPVVSMTAA